MKKFMGVLLGFLLVLSVVGSANANLITNGSFSDGLNDWLVINDGDIDFTIKDGWGDYTDHLAFSTGGAGQYGRLIQKFFIPTFATGINVSFDYQASFGESGNGNPWDELIDPSSYFLALVNLDLNGEGLYKYSNMEVILDTNETTKWTSVHMQFMFDGSPTNVDPNARIRFEWNEVDDWMSNVKLDNIVVVTNPVPEPATMLLFGLGILGLAGISRRKR